MKKLILGATIALISAGGLARADDVVYSSYTDGPTSGIIMFSSAPIKFISVIVSSPCNTGMTTIFRSTSPVVTADISTQVAINPLFTGSQVFPNSYEIHLYELYNTSYTYMGRAGNAKLTWFFNCYEKSDKQGICPGLKWSGGK